MTKPWPSTTPWEEALRLPHPSRDALHELRTHLKDDAVLQRFANLWMLEGVPVAFAEKPSDYELVRSALADRLSVEPHCVSLVGSARFGYSYTFKKWLKDFKPGPYSGASDYDFLVCDMELTKGCIQDLQTYIADQRSRLASADGAKADKFKSEIDERERQIERQLFNNNILPGNDLYPTFKRLNHAIGVVNKKYANELRGSKVKIRVYPDWGLAFRQNVRNLRANLQAVVDAELATPSTLRTSQSS